MTVDVRPTSHRAIELAVVRAPPGDRPVNLSSTCIACGAPLELWQGRPLVIQGRVYLRCATCHAAGALPRPTAPLPSPTPPEPPGRGSARRWFGRAAVTAVLLTAAAAGTAAWLHPTPSRPHLSRPDHAPTRMAPVTIPAVPPSEKLADARAADAPSRPAAAPVSSTRRGAHEWRWTPPELPPGAWVFPLPGGRGEWPVSARRRFGAPRTGTRAAECLAGHCGIDLFAPRGTPVVAVAAGTVRRVVHRRTDETGLYVEVSHGGVLTDYMHLDDIRADLAPGQEVAAGELLGNLGNTGLSAAPHLHFAVVVEQAGARRFVDPAPYLDEARVIELLDMTISALPGSAVLADASSAPRLGSVL